MSMTKDSETPLPEVEELDPINAELFTLAREGLLEIGVGEDGLAVFWATAKGQEVLGMSGPDT